MIITLSMGAGFLHPLLGILPLTDEDARRDASVRYYAGLHWRVRVVRSDGTRKWMSDTDYGKAVWEGTRDEAEHAAAERRPVYPNARYEVAGSWEVL